ncbi:MAG: HAD family hydrolase [Candidatus Micrarchaeota archaeon]|nr:HAD family hydrolase [Candidatus Micrarchaeota archaeon]
MIKVVSFDIDGTLIDEKADFLIWNVEIPKMYAKEKGIGIKEAEKIVFSDYYRGGYIEKIDKWTDIRYWFRRFGLSGWENLLDQMRNDIAVFDDVKDTLGYLKRKYTIIATTLNTEDFLKMKLEATGLENYFKMNFHSDSFSINKKNLTKNDLSLFRKVLDTMKVSPHEMVHIGNDPLTDMSIPSSLGIECYLIDRIKEKKGKNVIHSLTELKEIL